MIQLVSILHQKSYICMIYPAQQWQVPAHKVMQTLNWAHKTVIRVTCLKHVHCIVHHLPLIHIHHDNKSVLQVPGLKQSKRILMLLYTCYNVRWWCTPFQQVWNWERNWITDTIYNCVNRPHSKINGTLWQLVLFLKCQREESCCILC